MISGPQRAACGDREQVIAAELAFPVGDDPFVLLDGRLDLAVGQIRLGELLARPGGIGVPRALSPFALGQDGAVQRGSSEIASAARPAVW
jgi:hypothetical protein